ncbi:spore maturation protein [Paenalkalicoccus suaedae]|uniref:Spore maturation protein n=1 Tax=Paenalkalicoccus suaedae TaxID=2592382 RepID=A0A859FFN8_9BACI|nr:nucleoside recognition domain-containing protein [Paenalkalicoccus suaedae]QKS71046.1 spore maturation protein [Paenalkalicoccus suaedae]
MINVIWIVMILIGVGYAGLTGTMENVNAAIMTSSKDAVSLCIAFIGILAFWLGIMNIAERAGLIHMIGGILRPLLVRIFPDIPPKHPALGYIVSNISANMLGLGNAATPMGIKAMQSLKELGGNSDEATPSMVTLLAINTASITLIPTTVIAIRSEYGAANPTDIILATILATTVSTTAALTIDRFFRWKRGIV